MDWRDEYDSGRWSSDDVNVSFATIDDEMNNENVNESGSDNSIDDDVSKRIKDYTKRDQ